jgi:hypothetical protein
MTRPRAADDFAVIHARMEELRRESAPESADDDSAKRRPQTAGNKPGLPLAVRRALFPVRIESAVRPAAPAGSCG